MVHALLDSPSAAAAFRFTIHPGERTVFDTELALYPRAEIATVGIAPLTSMFLFDASERTRIDDYRTAVHDSNGLLLRTGKGEQIWRPLANPRELQISAFTDRGRRGFGLMQRSRALGDYQDLEARYENRLSLWVEPARDWGEGVVELVEIPTDREVNDNVVAFWRPHEPLKAKGEYIFNYRLHWCWSAPSEPPLSEVIATRSGLAWHSSAWRSLRHAPRGAQSWLEGAWTGPGVCSECSAFAARLMSWVSRTLNTNPAHKSAPVRQRSTLVFARSDIVDEPLREGVVASPKITDA